MRKRELAWMMAVAVLLGMQAGPIRAEEDPHAGCAAPPSYVPEDLLERQVTLREGVGNSRETVTTSDPQAQAFYNQGLNYLESYVWIEASRSFHQALRLDPKLAMAYLGLSRVASGLDNSEAAQSWFNKGKALMEGISDRERRRFDIRGKQLEAMQNLEDDKKFLAYKKSIDEALAADPDDPELWILRGNAEEGNASGRGQRGGASSVAFYERALQRVPDHATAHHYLVHSFETIGRMQEALEHGEAYAKLAPAIPHAAHMWAHDLRRVGRVDEAIAQFQKADALENAYYKAEKIDPAFDWHHGHNLDLLASCFEHKGQMKSAEKIFRESAGLGSVGAYPAFNKREMPGFLIHRGRYAEALEAAEKMTGSDFPQSRTAGHALAGEAYIDLGKVKEAEAELKAAQEELATVPVVTPGIVPRRATVEPLVEALQDEILMRTGKQSEGRSLLKEVQRKLRAMPGPDAWSQALFRLEVMARRARDAGDWKLAEYTAEQMLDHDAAYGGSHLAMALVLQKKGDAAGAAREFQAAMSGWRDADPDLAELKRIPKKVAEAVLGR